jgi:hypothetical protein
MSKNHPHDNIYSILGKLAALTPKEEPTAETPKMIYESVESQGSILKGLRNISTIESRLAEAFAKDKDDEHCKECDCKPCECPTNESKCNECGMFESKCSCTHTNEDMSRAAKGHEKYGKKGMEALAKAGRDGASEEELDKVRDKYNRYDEGVTTHQTGVTKHTKTDYPGYPVSDLDKDDEEERKAGKKGRPRKAQTKNPRRDPAAEKKGRGRPKKDASTSGEIRATNKSHDPFGRIAAGAHKRASVAESMNQLADSFLQELNEGRHIVDESGETLGHILNRFKHDVKQFEAGEDIYGTDLYDALFDYYCDSGEMPYGTQKARDGDPVEWISQRLDAELGNKAYGKDPANAEGHGIKDEAIDPTNPRDYEIPAFLRKQQGQAPLAMRDVMQKDKKPDHDFYQRRTGETHPDALKTELDELAQLAGLSEVSRGEYIKQQDTAAEKSGKNEFNAFGQLFKTDQVDEDPEVEFEGNEFSGELAKAKAQHKDSFEVDGKEYPVQEDKIEVDGDDEENTNKPKPKYGTIKAITTQGDDLNRQKKQDPRTANRAANPLTNVTTLESELAAEYESIKKSTK